MLENNCLNCVHAKEVPMPGPNGEPLIGKRMHLCMRTPPTPVMVQTGQTTASVVSMFPPVTADMYCAEHTSIIPANDVN